MSGLSFSKRADRRARVRDATRLGICTVAIVLVSAMPMSAQGLGGLGEALGDTVGGVVDTVDSLASPASDSFSDSGGVGGTVADAGQGTLVEGVGNTVAEVGEIFNGPNRDGNDDIGDSAGALLDSVLPAAGTATDGLLQTTGDLLNGGPTASCTGPNCPPGPPQPPLPPQPPQPCNTPQCRPPNCIGNNCDPRQPTMPRTPVVGGGGGGCSLPGNSTAYNGLRAVSNDGVMLGTVTDVFVTPGLEIERVAFLTDRSPGASRPYCVQIGNVPINSQNGQVVVGVSRSAIVQAAVR